MNISNIKKDFPIFSNVPELVYLDSTATSLKPQSVIDAEIAYYEKYSANIYRGVYKMSEKATEEYEKTRAVIKEFINAKSTNEVIFTRNTTESVNVIAYGLGRQIIEEGDEVVTTIMEHHSNFVPWQQLAFEQGADFKVINVDKNGYLAFIKNGMIDMQELSQAITKKTKIFALTYVSNVLGTINPVKEIIQAVRKINPQTIIVVDAAQAIPHMKVDVQDLDCDFLAFSSHKMLGPTGVGVLWGKYELLNSMFPFQYGSEMIIEVTPEKSTFKKPPEKFEPGTAAIAQVIALKDAVNYLQKIGLDNIRQHEKEITEYAMKKLKEVFAEKIRILGPPSSDDHAGIIAFDFANYHPHDIAQILDESNIAIRSGHHCAMPLHKNLRINATARASFYLYNDFADVDKLIGGLEKVAAVLK